MIKSTRQPREKISSSCPNFFFSPEPAGRKITAGFTYLQRIGKAASFDVWFPDAFKFQLEKHLAAGGALDSKKFPAQWAAVRQFELLQEAGNHKIYDLDPANPWRATRDLSASMRAGGYRILVATLGSYAESSSGDELELLDLRLQERIARMIHMLYLEDQSEQMTLEISRKLKENTWRFSDEFPHINMVLGAHDLFFSHKHDAKRRKKGEGDSRSQALMTKGHKHQRAKHFFKILNQLPHKHIVHDTAIGLQLPEFNGEHQWNYIASSDETLAAFNRVLGDLFNHQTFHLRGYGDRMSPSSQSFYRKASLSLI